MTLGFTWTYSEDQSRWVLSDGRRSKGWVTGRVTEDGKAHDFVAWRTGLKGSTCLGGSNDLDAAKRMVETR